MPKLRNLKIIFEQWGGSTAAFFSYLHLSHDLTGCLLVALLPMIRESLGLSYLQSGLLLSAYAITAGLFQFPGGWIGDRVSRHIVIAIGLVGVNLATFAVGLSSAYYPLLVILVIMGIFSGPYHPSAIPMLSDYFEATRRGKVLAIHAIGGSIAFTIGPVLGGLIAKMLGWRFAFIILSILALVAAPLAFLVLKKFKQQERTNKDRLVSQSPTKDDVTSQPMNRRIGIGQVLRPIATIAVLIVLMQLISGSIISFIPIYLVDKHNIAPASAAMLIGIIRGGGIAGSLFGGWLSDRWSRKNVIFLALVASGPILYLFTKLPFSAGLIVVFILLGMVLHMRQAAFQPFLMDNTPPHLRATILGLYFGLAMEGSSLVQPLTGHFMDIFGIVEVFNVIALIGIGLSLVALFLAKKPKLHR